MSELDHLAGHQYGLLTIEQLRTQGLTRRQIEHRMALGRYVSVRPGMLRMEGSPISKHQAWLAAILAAGGHVVLSHATAAEAWSLRGFDSSDAIDLLTTGSRPQLVGVRAHHTISLPRGDHTVLHYIPVTTPERTLVDACGLVPFITLERACDDALRRRLIHLPRLVRCVQAVPLSGRRKIRPVRALLAERVPGYDAGGSDAELNVMKILKRAGISPLPKQQYRVSIRGRTYILDYAWPDTRVAIEYDGDPHAVVSALHHDRQRIRDLQWAEWLVWPVTSRTSEAEIIAIGVAATSQEPAA